MVRRIAVVIGVLAVGVIASAAPAWAHVTVAPDSAPKGASDVEIAFRVPNEEATASTTKLQVALPSTPPLLDVLTQSMPGWTAAVVTTHLAKPITTDDGPVSDVVTQITWTADNAASAIKPGEFQRFEIIVGSLPDSGDQIVFRAIQTYSNGDVVKWIDPVTSGGPAAEHPTPILALTSPTPEAGQSATTTTVANGSAGASTEHVASKSDTDTAKTLGIIALVISVLALIGVAILLFRKRPATS